MFDELFGGLDKKYARKFNWVDIRDDQGPSLAALDSVLDKRHPLYHAKREAALARREPGGDVLYLLEGGVYVIVNPTNPSYNDLGQLTYREFSNLQNTIRYVHEGYAEEHVVDTQLDSDEMLAEILEETREPKAQSKFWHMYLAVTAAVHYITLMPFAWIFNGSVNYIIAPVIPIRFVTLSGEIKQEPVAWVFVNFAVYALLRFADYIVKKKTNFTIFDNKRIITAIVVTAAVLFAATAAVIIPIANVSVDTGGYLIFYLYVMPLYMGLIVHSTGIYLFHSWLKDKMEF